MVYELPKLEDVIDDHPFLNKSINECQQHSNEFYECLQATEDTINGIVEEGKTYNSRVKGLTEVLENAATVVPDHAAALEKVKCGDYNNGDLMSSNVLSTTHHVESGPHTSRRVRTTHHVESGPHIT